MSFCRTCHSRRTHVSITEADLARLARRCARKETPKLLALLPEVRAQLDRSRQAQRLHEAECELLVGAR